MKKSFFLFLFSCFSFSLWASDATMYQWKSHFAYGSVSQVVDAGNVVFGLAGGALYSVDKSSEEVRTYSKQSGLNGGEIASLAYDAQSQTLIIAYTDGLIDFLHNGQFLAMTDLKQKSITASKHTNKIVMDNGIAYFCMPFGIMAVDVKKQQVKDTYYIGEDGSDVDVIDLTLDADSIYAISTSIRYSAARDANWMDFASWSRSQQLPSSQSYHAIAIWQKNLFVLINQSLQQRKGSTWSSPCPDKAIKGLCLTKNNLFLLLETNGIHYLDENFVFQQIASPYIPWSITSNATTYWLATSEDGIVRQTSTDLQSFVVNGPLVNSPYRMRFNGDKMIMVPGGYYVNMTYQKGCVMVLDNDLWEGFTYEELIKIKNKGQLVNLCDAIIDPKDLNHYYVAGLGAGLIEFINNEPYQWLYSDNSPLEKIASRGEDYTWVDGLAYDSKGNLWMINISGVRNIKVLMADGSWISLDHKAANSMSRARDLLIWNKNENIKIITCNHTQRGLVILDDNGTIANQADDQCVFLTEFIDQDNNAIQLTALYSIIQDKSGALWIGTDAGLIVIDDPSKLFTSNACRKIKIPRNDGTGLADYLLETEVIQSMAVDGSNRKWIGTESSGLYLVSSDGLETIYHFTKDNSPLPDNTIQSLAIQPSTGCVFVGTGKGLLSYQSDAAPAVEDYSNVYAYPNPVRPDFEGVITIRGLMDETIVHIVDNAGNLVCETRSNGGLAIWDGKTADGRRAASGVYTVFLNETSGDSRAVTKILLMH